MHTRSFLVPSRAVNRTQLQSSSSTHPLLSTLRTQLQSKPLVLPQSSRPRNKSLSSSPTSSRPQCLTIDPSSSSPASSRSSPRSASPFPRRCKEKKLASRLASKQMDNSHRVGRRVMRAIEDEIPDSEEDSDPEFTAEVLAGYRRIFAAKEQRRPWRVQPFDIRMEVERIVPHTRYYPKTPAQ